MPRSDLPTDSKIAAWVALMRASNSVLAAVRADSKAADIPPPEWYDVLWELERAPDGSRRPFELEGRLLLAQYNLSRLIDRLSRAGYVEKRKCPEDGRGLVLVITEAGKALRKRMWITYSAAIERHVGSKLTAEEAEKLSALLLRLFEPGDRGSKGGACPQTG